jgi:hypothetical protein
LFVSVVWILSFRGGQGCVVGLFAQQKKKGQGGNEIQPTKIFLQEFPDALFKFARFNQPSIMLAELLADVERQGLTKFTAGEEDNVRHLVFLEARNECPEV